jgi:hypothetical protein
MKHLLIPEVEMGIHGILTLSICRSPLESALHPIRVGIVRAVPRKYSETISKHVKNTRITKYIQGKDTIHSTSE